MAKLEGRFDLFRQEDGTLEFVPVSDADSIILPGFYLSQWDKPGVVDSVPVDADERRGDCGPAALGTIIYAYSQYKPTVDRIADACGQPKTGKGSYYTTFSQLNKGAHVFGLALKYVYREYEISFIINELRAGRMSIGLINYGALYDAIKSFYPDAVQNQDKFRGGHWVTAVGFVPGHPQLGDCILINDPDFWTPYRQNGDHRYVPVGALEMALKTPPSTGDFTVPYQGIRLVK